MMNATNLDRAQSISAKTCLNATERKSVLPCEATLYIGFFFDGFGRNLVEDLKENRLTNVARLFLAYPGDTKNLEAQPDAQLAMSPCL